jgi:hypothetical protein
MQRDQAVLIFEVTQNGEHQADRAQLLAGGAEDIQRRERALHRRRRCCERPQHPIRPVCAAHIA